MLSLSVLSRRSLVVLTALAAVAPKAEARKQPPLAFAVATLTDVAGTPDAGTFGFAFRAAVAHPASGAADEFSESTFVDSDASADQVRKAIAAALQNTARIRLSQLGQTVPADRIAVVVL